MIDGGALYGGRVRAGGGGGRKCPGTEQKCREERVSLSSLVLVLRP